MNKSLQLLNAVREYIVNYANENGVNLKKEFGTREAFQKFVIALTITTLIEAGLGLEEAFDLAMGEGRYGELVEKIWTANQA